MKQIPVSPGKVMPVGDEDCAFLTTGYRGIHKVGNGFTAWIRANGRRLYLGWFPSILDAERAYDAAANWLSRGGDISFECPVCMADLRARLGAE